MAIKPILFNKQISTEMVRAILDGRKTCTRRLVKFLPGENSKWTGYIKDGLMLYNGRNEPCIRNAPYQPGDILYVRETFAWGPCWDCGLDTIPDGCKNPVIYDSKKKEHGCYIYRADCEDNECLLDLMILWMLTKRKMRRHSLMSSRNMMMTIPLSSQTT